MKLIGIDDAGRGPVIGPMVLCGVMVDSVEVEKKLKELGAKDSKLLGYKLRKKLSDNFKLDYKYHCEIANPKEIDDFPNLNNLEAIKCAIIINSLTKDLNEKVRVFIDCPSVNINAWSEFVASSLLRPELIELVCEHKADLNHPIVSAASIIAKETREDILKDLKKELGVNFGSGYPADPMTRDFLVKTYGEERYDQIIRKSWSTYKKIKERMGQKSLFYL
jgi:ribonuclease HII